jgi:hypothetical protein
MFIFKDGKVIQHTEAFPTTCFPANVTIEMLQELDAGIKPMSAFIEHNRDTHKLVSCEPKEVDGVVYGMEAVELSADELQAIMKSKVAKVKAEITQAVQQRLDAFAQTRNYDSILSACTYASSTVPQFSYEGQQCIDLRDATWGALYDIMRGVETGSRAMPPGYSDIEAELPVCEWQA